MAKIFCPNTYCGQHKKPQPKGFLKKGKAKGFKGRNYQQYQCKDCGRKFSSRKLHWKSSFKNTDIIYDIFSRYTGGTPIQRIADDLKISKITVIKTIRFLGKKIKAYHYHQLDSPDMTTYNVAFDEMESYVRSRAYPVSIGVTICGTTQRIIDIGVAYISFRGREIPQPNKRTKSTRFRIRLSKNFKPKPDGSTKMCEAVIKSVSRCIYEQGAVITDDKPAYRTLIKNLLPEVQHYRIKSKGTPKKKKKKTTRAYRKKPLPPVPEANKIALQRLNSVQGVLRTYCPRLHHQSKTISKSFDMLVASLYMNLAYMNHYNLDKILAFE